AFRSPTRHAASGGASAVCSSLEYGPFLRSLAARAELHRVRPDLQVWRLDPVCAKGRIYLRAVIAAVVHELRQRRPGIHLEAQLIRAAQWRFGDEASAVDVAAAEAG